MKKLLKTQKIISVIVSIMRIRKVLVMIIETEVMIGLMFYSLKPF